MKHADIRESQLEAALSEVRQKSADAQASRFVAEKKSGMIFMLDTGPAQWEHAVAEVDAPIGQLLTPSTRYSARGITFGIDNGCFTGFDEAGFLSLLAREVENRSRCKFVAAPDVVGSARRTLEVFEHWYPLLHGWPIALVIQDGQQDLPIPWALIRAVFIGGSTEFKLSPQAAHVVKAAKILGKWVHIGRINTGDRFAYFEKLGADSCDGNGVSRFTARRKEINSETLFSGIIGR